MGLLLLASGGTIASRLDASGAVVPAVGAEELLAAVPELEAHGPITVEEVARVNGWNVDPPTMLRIADRARDALLGGEAEGVVVTHGTDTVEETLYLTDLIAGDATERGPITFACAMRFASDVGADGPRNLLHAALVARSEHARGRGALLCVNDEVHAARWATKTDTTNVSTFRSPPAGPVGRVDLGGVRFQLATPSRPPVRREVADGHERTAVEQAVPLLKVFTGMDDRPLRWLVDEGAQGIVVEGTGAGNVPGGVVPGISYALERGVPVVVTSRCWTGPAVPIYGGPGGGVTLSELGVLRSNGLNGPKARLALMVALGVTRDLDELRAWFADV